MALGNGNGKQMTLNGNGGIKFDRESIRLKLIDSIKDPNLREMANVYLQNLNDARGLKIDKGQAMITMMSLKEITALMILDKAK